MFSLKLLGGASIEGPDGPVTGSAVQRRRLGLLALLAAAPERGISRDKLVGYLWPERDEERARHALSDSVYRLNRELGRRGDPGSGGGAAAQPRRHRERRPPVPRRGGTRGVGRGRARVRWPLPRRILPLRRARVRAL